MMMMAGCMPLASSVRRMRRGRRQGEVAEDVVEAARLGHQLVDSDVLALHDLADGVGQILAAVRDDQHRRHPVDLADDLHRLDAPQVADRVLCLRQRVGVHREPDRVVVARAALQLVRPRVGHDPAAGDHDGAGADRVDLLEDVGRDDDRLVLGHVADEAADLVLLVRVEAVGGLVQHQDRRVVEDRLGEPDAALEALREGLDRPMQDLLELRALDGLADPPRPLEPVQAAHGGDEAEEAVGRHVAVERRALRQVADLTLGLDRPLDDVVTHDRRGAAGRRDEAGQHPHRGRLPGPVRAQEAQHLAANEAEADVLHGVDRAEPLREAVEANHLLDHYAPTPTRQLQEVVRGEAAWLGRGCDRSFWLSGPRTRAWLIREGTFWFNPFCRDHSSIMSQAGLTDPTRWVRLIASALRAYIHKVTARQGGGWALGEAITMRELQKMSAGAIRSLPHAVPVKSGAATVALLVPIQKASPELVASVLARIDAATAKRSPEQTAALEVALGEREQG